VWAERWDMRRRRAAASAGARGRDVDGGEPWPTWPLRAIRGRRRAACVWDVAFTAAGDLASACADYAARLWTPDAARAAPAAAQQARPCLPLRHKRWAVLCGRPVRPPHAQRHLVMRPIVLATLSLDRRVVLRRAGGAMPKSMRRALGLPGATLRVCQPRRQAPAPPRGAGVRAAAGRAQGGRRRRHGGRRRGRRRAAGGPEAGGCGRAGGARPARWADRGRARARRGGRVQLGRGPRAVGEGARRV